MATANSAVAAQSPKDFYSLLGVSPEATPTEIREAFYRQARVCHPDARPNDKEAAAKFLAVKEAYSTLSDSSSRREYDQIFFGSGTLGQHEAAAARVNLERETSEEELAALKKLKEDMEVQMKTRQAIAPHRVWTWKHEKKTRRFSQVLRTPNMVQERFGKGPKEEPKSKIDVWVEENIMNPLNTTIDDNQTNADQKLNKEIRLSNTSKIQINHRELKVGMMLVITVTIVALAYFSSAEPGTLGSLSKESNEYKNHMKALGFQIK